MFTYEFVTPSDPITFKAKDDKIAFIIAVLLGSGKAGCTRLDEYGKNVNIPSMLMFSSDAKKEMTEFLGQEGKDFYEANRLDIAEALESFAYTHLSDRKQFDSTLDMIPVEKRAEFLSMHEDTKRSSMNRWVHYAWESAAKIRETLKNPSTTQV